MDDGSDRWARAVGLRTTGPVAGSWAAPRESEGLAAVRRWMTGSPPAWRAPEGSPYRMFYAAGMGMASDLRNLHPSVTAIGVDLLTMGDVGIDALIGLLRDRRNLNLFLDNGAFSLHRRGLRLSTSDVIAYLGRASDIVAALEAGGCCTAMLVAPDVIGDGGATWTMRNDRALLSGYWELALRGAFVMFPIHGVDPEVVDAQIEQVCGQLDALHGATGVTTWPVVIGIPANAAAASPATVGRIARRALACGFDAGMPINWFHLLGTSRSRPQAGAWTVGQLARPIVQAFEEAEAAGSFDSPVRPIITSDSARGVLGASRTGLVGQDPRRAAAIAAEALSAWRGAERSAAPDPQIALFGVDDPLHRKSEGR